MQSRPLAQLYFLERIPAINVQPAIRGQRRSNSRPCLDARLRMPSVQGTDADGESQVEWFLVQPQLKVLHGDVPCAEEPRSDFGCRVPLDLLNPFCGPVDDEDVAAADAPRDFPGRSPRRATDLQDPESRPERQGLNDGGEAGRQGVHGAAGTLCKGCFT